MVGAAGGCLKLVLRTHVTSVTYLRLRFARDLEDKLLEMKIRRTRNAYVACVLRPWPRPVDYAPTPDSTRL